MAKILITYYSRTGHTERMARLVAEGVAGCEVEVKRVQDTKVEDLLAADGIIIGSPTYYGLPAWEVKRLLDESVSHHGELAGKVGAAFTSSANIGGGNETTILAILEAMLIHGMIVQGSAAGDHYGPVSIESPDGRVERQCRALGARTASLVRRLHP